MLHCTSITTDNVFRRIKVSRVEKVAALMLRSKKKIILISLSCVLVGAATYPFESTVVPPWKVKVVEVYGAACSNMPVTESWAHYSLFLDGHFQSADQLTDPEGFVEFPERRIRAIGLRRLIMPIVTKVLTIAHGSTGVHGTVSVSGPKDVAWLSYKSDKPLPDTARAEKCITKEDLRSKEAR